jgi:hypothetical protein
MFPNRNVFKNCKVVQAETPFMRYTRTVDENFTGYMCECEIRCRENEGPLFVVNNDVVMPNLHGYAIVPKEYLHDLEKRVDKLGEMK